MTVSYQYDVASSTSGGFTRLLFKWKGSLYKLVYRELALFCLCYGITSICYRHLLFGETRKAFERLVIYCDTFSNYIPLSFILGFYVSFVASRWWQQYLAIPWPDKLLHCIALHVSGHDEKSRMMRRTMVRYINLSMVLVLRSISSAVKKRFPTLEHLVEAGFITTTELGLYKLVPSLEFNTYWVPFTWFTALLKDARAQRRIADPLGLKIIMEEFNEFRQKCGMLWSYDWVSIPLVYTQVVTIATYSFFISCVIGRQYVDSMTYKMRVDTYIPVFTILQFFFYMGLLKVGEQIINPFGDDDEDFELNWIIDRHIKVSYLVVDTLLIRTPPLCRDKFWDDESPNLPYTEAAAIFKKRTFRGSVANMVVPEDKQGLLLPEIVEEAEDAEESLKDSTHCIKCQSGSYDAPATPGIYDETCLTEEEGKNTSPRIPRRESDGKCLSPSCALNKKYVTPGTRGIKSALLAVGSNQGFFTTNTEVLSNLIDTGQIVPGNLEAGGDAVLHDKIGDDLQHIVVPVQEVSLDIEGAGYDIEEQGKKLSRNSFKLPASLKAKLAIRKKPVIKWRPYVRPSENTNLSNDCLNGSAPGLFEDECAFMWKTIEYESSSLYTAKSNLSEEMAAEEGESKFLSHYQDPFLNYPCQAQNGKDEVGYKRPIAVHGSPRLSTRRRLRNRRHSFPAYSKLSRSSRTVSLRFLKCLSEASVFLEAFNSHIKQMNQLKETEITPHSIQRTVSSSVKPFDPHCLSSQVRSEDNIPSTAPP